MREPERMAALFLAHKKGHQALGHNESADQGQGEDGPLAPDEHRHEGDQIMREHMDAVAKNDHHAAHDAMTALIDHHMAKKMMGK